MRYAWAEKEKMKSELNDKNTSILNIDENRNGTWCRGIIKKKKLYSTIFSN